VFKTLNISGDPISQELMLIIHLLQDDSNWREDDVNECVGNIDWVSFMRLVRHHRVYPLIYEKLKKVKLSQIPLDIMKSLESQYNLNTLRMLQLSSELCCISKALEDAGIRNIVLKGPVLAKQLYDDINLRTSKDLDILISLDDVENAEETLHALGYTSEQKPLNWKKKSHHLSYRHELHTIQVEIHWRLSPKFERKQTFDLLWERRQKISVANQSIYVLRNEELLIYLSDHGARHGWFRLRWLVDMDRLLKCDFNLDELKLAISKHGGLPFISQAVLLAQTFFSTSLTENVEILIEKSKSQQLAQLALECIIKEIDGNSKKMKKYNRKLYSFWDFKQKFSHILIRIAPSEDDVAHFPLVKGLYFLYVPLRPFLWILRQIKGSTDKEYS